MHRELQINKTLTEKQFFGMGNKNWFFFLLEKDFFKAEVHTPELIIF